MTSTSIRRGIVPGIAALALTLTACGAGNEESSADTGSGDGGSSLSGTLAGGGSSAQEKAQAAWRAGFQGENPDVTINYDPVGSGDGRANFISEAYVFAGTDSALNDEEGEVSDATARCADGNVIQVPAYVSPIAVVYSLEGVDTLNLSPETVANIFNGSITTWNDDAIAADNPDVQLPDSAITPVHRQDDSGTTENFTAYLADASGGAWSDEPDGLWPSAIKGGEAAEGTSGVIGAVEGGDGTIGYADLSAVGELSVANIKVGEEFVAPSAEGAAKVVAISPPVEGAGETDMAVELDRATTESGAYPVLLVSYLVACETYGSEEEAELVREYLTYVVSEDGQQAAAAEAGSAPLDAALSEKATGLIENISAG